MLSTELQTTPAVPPLNSQSPASNNNLRLLIVNFRYRLNIIDDDVGILLLAKIAHYLNCPFDQTGTVTVLPQPCPASEYRAKMLARALSEIELDDPPAKRVRHHHHHFLGQAKLVPLHQFFPTPLPQAGQNQQEGGEGATDFAENTEFATVMPLEELANLTCAGTIYYDVADVTYQLLAEKLLRAAGLQANSSFLAGLIALDRIVVIPPLGEALGLPLGQKLASLLPQIDRWITVGQLTQLKPRLRLEVFD